jgi:aminoglycoside phosphotransferase family enzyme
LELGVTEKSASSPTRLEDSAALVKNLVRVGEFPGPTQDIRVVETHISWVLLTGAYAYKIKKPVNLGFLDFSTLEQRRHFCAEELRLNRRFAADLYLDVVDIGGTADRPVMDVTEGPVLEVAVRMRQFPDDALLSHQVVEDKISIADMVGLGVAVARLHADAPVADTDSEYGSPAAVVRPVEENFQTLEDALPDKEQRRRLEAIRDWTRAEARRAEPMILQRKRAGSVRECHGDLHLANLVHWQDRIVPFDCLEFDAALRWIDVISEVAFLFMDTLRAGRPDLAYAFLNRYLSESGDYAGIFLLPFYIVYRAMVRAKVQALTGREKAGDKDVKH